MNKLFDVIDEKWKIDLGWLIFVLGIWYVGENSVNFLVVNYGSWVVFEVVMIVVEVGIGIEWENLLSIDGVGVVMVILIVMVFY